MKARKKIKFICQEILAKDTFFNYWQEKKAKGTMFLSGYFMIIYRFLGQQKY